MKHMSVLALLGSFLLASIWMPLLLHDDSHKFLAAAYTSIDDIVEVRQDAAGEQCFVVTSKGTGSWNNCDENLLQFVEQPESSMNRGVKRKLLSTRKHGVHAHDALQAISDRIRQHHAAGPISSRADSAHAEELKPVSRGDLPQKLPFKSFIAAASGAQGLQEPVVVILVEESTDGDSVYAIAKALADPQSINGAASNSGDADTLLPIPRTIFANASIDRSWVTGFAQKENSPGVSAPCLLLFPAGYKAPKQPQVQRVAGKLFYTDDSGQRHAIKDMSEVPAGGLPPTPPCVAAHLFTRKTQDKTKQQEAVSTTLPNTLEVVSFASLALRAPIAVLSDDAVEINLPEELQREKNAEEGQDAGVGGSARMMWSAVEERHLYSGHIKTDVNDWMADASKPVKVILVDDRLNRALPLLHLVSAALHYRLQSTSDQAGPHISFGIARDSVIARRFGLDQAQVHKSPCLLAMRYPYTIAPKKICFGPIDSRGETIAYTAFIAFLDEL